MMLSLMWRMARFQRRCIVSHISVVIVFNCLQAKLDDALEEIVLKLSDKYHPGLCPLHPDLPYFHHRTSDLHFKLNWPQLLVWALAIRSDTTTYEKVPILSPMFNALSALKHVSKNTTNSNAAAAPMMTMPPTMPPAMPPAMLPAMLPAMPPTAELFTSMPFQGQVPAMPFPSLFQYPQYPQMLFPQFPPQMPMFMGYGGPSMPHAGHPVGTETVATMASHHQPQSPPSSPPTTSCSVTNFCEKYDLGWDAEIRLKNPGFRFGADLLQVMAIRDIEARFKPLEWRWVLRAYKQLKQDNRHA